MIDCHVHFDDPRFDHDRIAVHTRALEVGIKKMIVPAVSRATWSRTKTVCREYSNLYVCYGLHPYFIDQHTEEDLQELSRWLEKEKAIALGECGLDYYLKELDRKKQQEFFIAQLQIAKVRNLPVVLHARKAVEDVILSLKRTGVERGMIHSFNGSLQQAEQLIEMGFYLSFGGAVTYSGSHKLHKLIKKIPPEFLLIETDAPDQPDELHRGLRNEPAYIKQVYQAVADLKACSQEDLIMQVNKNVHDLFTL